MHKATLHGNVPEGKWVVERVMMETTGVTNSPAMPDATGLEIDKMSKGSISPRTSTRS